jgi:hypothetical protein
LFAATAAKCLAGLNGRTTRIAEHWYPPAIKETDDFSEPVSIISTKLPSESSPRRERATEFNRFKLDQVVNEKATRQLGGLFFKGE